MNTLDTRDLYKRLCELQALRDTLEDARQEREDIGASPGSTREEIDAANKAVEDAESEYSEDEGQELAELEELESEVSGFMHGVQLIPDHDFQEYAEQYAEDIGAIPDNAAWPCTCIDWEQAAKELQSDFSSITFQGTDYLYQA